MSMALLRGRLYLLVTAVLVASVVTPGECLDNPRVPNIFYPFGDDAGDARGPIGDDGFTPAINIPGGFPFFGTRNTLVYVNLNGAFTFGVGFGGYTPTPFPIVGYNVVAPYWADVDVRKNDGWLYYRTSTDPALLTRASNDVRATFSTQCLTTFRATWIFIATWYEVTYYGGSSTTPVNSYQGILITDGTNSFTIFNYGTLTWTTGTASGGDARTGLGGIAAQVGFNAGDGVTYYVVPASRTNAIVNIYEQSNVGITGRWMFRVDKSEIGPTGCVLNPTSCTLASATGLCVDSATCTFLGDSHYLTFDWRRFDYQGICKYLVAKPKVRSTALPYFEVYARGEHRYGITSVSWAYYVEIVYGADTIRFRRVGEVSIPPPGTVNVTVNGVPVDTPRCSCGSDYSIYLVGNFMRFITSFGLVVEYDGRSIVNVIVPPQYRDDKLTGICGNFDGIATNDATECNGRTYSGTDVNFFGDTCVVDDPEPPTGGAPLPCPAPPAPSDPCLTNPPTEYVTYCGALKDPAGPFAECIGQLDTQIAGTSTVLYNDCILDACLSNGLELCNNVWSLLEKCSNLGFQIDCDEWQRATNCAVTCPAGSGMVFSCNASSVCHRTCNNPGVSDTCTRPNKAACVCPPGTILNNGVCTDTCLGGCVDSTGAFRQVGDTWLGPDCTQLTCTACDTCESTFRVISYDTCPTGKTCVNSQCVAPTPAVCWCVGDPHCYSFDGLFPINYQGTCEFLLAGVINSSTSAAVTAFQVYARNDDYFSPGYTAVSYVANVRLVFGANEIILTRNFNVPWIPVTLSVNNAVKTIPYTQVIAGYKVYYAGSSVRIETSFGVVVEYDGYTTASVTVPPSYQSLLTGLCGNFDGDVDNDWTTADGTYVGNDTTARTNLLGDSYIVGPSTVGNCSEPAPPTPGPGNCDGYDTLETLCTGSIQSSTDCVAAVGNEVVNAFIAECILDACLSDSGVPACTVVSKFFELCSRHNVSVSCSDWQTAGCGAVLANLRCPAGLTYKCDAPACTATCDNPTPRDGCSLPNREGCVCPEGQLLAADGTCYTTCPVGCMTDGVLRPVGSTWNNPTTCASLTCVACSSCANGGNIVSTACSGSCVAGTCITEIAVCVDWGDPHFTTFDQLFYSYQGVCKYNLASVVSGSNLPAGFSEFEIYSRGEPRSGWSSDVSFVKYVEIVIDGSAIRISRSLSLVAAGAAIPAVLTINGFPASIPISVSSFKVFYSGSTVRLETNFGVALEFDGSWTARVYVPKVQYAGLLEGLCGNNDDNAANDWTLANGTSVAGVVNAETILGDSFVVVDDPEIDPASPCPVTPPNNPSPCIPVPPANELGCNILKDTTGPFADCINAIGASAAGTIYDNCLFDACYSNGSSICDSVAAFVSLCQNIGSPVSCEDFLSTPCAANCPTGMTFQCATSSCPATCAVPDAPRTCTRPTIDSCACPIGQFLRDGQCTATCPVGCVDSMQQFHPVGTSWRGTDCTVYTCVSEGRTTQSTCLSNEICVSDTCVPDQSVCYCLGDPHCATFDGLYFSYQGICRYNMASVNANAPASLQKFQIYSKNEYRYGNTEVSWVKYVEIQIDGGDTIRLTGDFESTNAIAVTTYVNSAVVYPPFVGPASSYTIQLSGSIVLFQASFGVSIAFDGRFALFVTIPRTLYSGYVNGLCGNNDNDVVNDWTTAYGLNVNGQPLAANLLGDSFVVLDATVENQFITCPAGPPPEICAPTTPALVACHARCEVLTDIDGVFGRCIAVIGATEATALYNGCLLDACFTNGSSICMTFKATIDYCITRGVAINSCSVLRNTGCDTIKVCPAGMTYQCNAPGCAATCTNPNPGPTCQIPNRDACVCPDGMLLHQGECVSTCPQGCIDGNMQLQPIGAQWRGRGCNTYLCQACADCALGAEIVLVTCGPGEKCYRNRCLPPSSLCTCYGDVHCETFDGLRYNYQGTCKYNLASVTTRAPGLPFFQVFSRSENRYGQMSVSWVKYAEIVYGGDTVRLENNQYSHAAVPVVALLNGLQISVSPPYNGPGYVISTYGSGLRYEAASIGLVVYVDIWSVTVNTSNTFSALINGLCGNFDGNQPNDLVTADGTDVSDQPREQGSKMIGDSYVVDDPEQLGGTAPCPAPITPPSCIPPSPVLAQCGFLNPFIGVFNRCMEALGEQDNAILIEDCLVDACNSNGASVCFTLKVVVDECNRLGFPIAISDWLEATGCEAVITKCPVGMIFANVMSGCQPTCEDPTADQTCTLPDTSGCVCPSGQLLLDGVCTPVCPNGCVDGNGIVNEVGTSWEAGNCTNATCVACDNCPLNHRVQLTPRCCAGEQCVNETCVNGTGGTGGTGGTTLTPEQIARCRVVNNIQLNRSLYRKCRFRVRRRPRLAKLCKIQGDKVRERRFCNDNGIF